jgi:hypothetical protein
MRTVKYKLYWGPTDLFYRRRKSSLSEFVLDIFYLMEDAGVIPPFAVLNQVLQEGGDSGGMSPGTKWKPFIITEVEYEELVKELLEVNPTEARKKHPYVRFNHIVIDEELSEITTYEKWHKKVSEKYRRIS